MTEAVQQQEQLEQQLNDFDPDRRAAALDELIAMAEQGDVSLPAPKQLVNLHCHTFFSYNGYGYSPTCFAWKARQAGLAVAGVVDFDVLDAVEEFLSASARLGLKGCAGLETRVFVPEFAEREINSPGEPGITYQMGYGYVRGGAPDSAFLDELKETARQRTLDIIQRVNAHLDPLTIDYDEDVLPLTPNGNATERHVCRAYEAKAVEMFPDEDERARFWAPRLKLDEAEARQAFADSPRFQALIRSKLMKSGGPGYMKPDSDAFPRLQRFNAFVLEAGAIPAATWLDGLSAGEQAIDELLRLQMETGAAALNLIPERNWNIADRREKEVKLENLYGIVEKAMDLGLPLIVGTEMNAPGLPFADNFESDELAPVVAPFMEGAYVMYAHTILEMKAGIGYLSPWAKEQFPGRIERNAFFARVGEIMDPANADRLAQIGSNPEPSQVLDAANAT